MNARMRAKATKVKSKHLKEALAKAEANLVSKKKKWEAKVAKAKKKIAEVEKKAKEKAMLAYKVLMDLPAEKAWTVVAFRMLEKFNDDYYQFCKEAFHKGFKLG